MTSASRWIVLLGLADTPVIRAKIRKIQVDALEWCSQTGEPAIFERIRELKQEDHEVM